MDKRPIGVFDSGLGGLTVLKEINKRLPNEDIIYFGDTARVPYGHRSKETIMKYTFQAINFLLTKDVKAIVIACNTATARALVESQEKYDIPIMGVIDAGAKSAVEYTKNKVVGVIGTSATINSKAYNKVIHSIDNSVEVIGKACPLFVPLAEEGWANEEISSIAAHMYLDELVDAGVDSIVLGCTHYPILKRTIGEAVGMDIKLINPAKETALSLKKVLKKNSMLNEREEEGVCKYFVSDINEQFSKVAGEFLKREIPEIEKVEIQKY
ncbi:glutamate racemase [Peptostreptococcus russellii]|uniref:Glutamate racemase n=1 Tax=Peptostreptococcus russellii TaxID=215200 RepID=A0A1H8JMA6_9FIRM|nr:glutamate racemase [Peptostreptococcus russellii]MBC2577082.1 glutamate racemase [Peptostreptococcus russellii]SEN81870.1 glutamate racemase [Peptostreptococcus russellii]